MELRSIFSALVILFLFVLVGCNSNRPVSSSSVKKADVQAITDVDGKTIEQKNVSNRITNDNKIGAIKYLYVISPYSGQVIIYSTVRGKVSSSGKRLTPYSVNGYNENIVTANNYVIISGKKYITDEVLQDDGTYGSSDPYIYWWDTKGVYHQHFVTGGQIITVSDQPLNVGKVIITIE